MKIKFKRSPVYFKNFIKQKIMENAENKKLKKKLKAFKGKATPVFVTIAIVIVGALVMKLVADKESRIDF